MQYRKPRKKQKKKIPGNWIGRFFILRKVCALHKNQSNASEFQMFLSISASYFLTGQLVFLVAVPYGTINSNICPFGIRLCVGLIRCFMDVHTFVFLPERLQCFLITLTLKISFPEGAQTYETELLRVLA